jgi:hypothetical protein
MKYLLLILLFFSLSANCQKLTFKQRAITTSIDVVVFGGLIAGTYLINKGLDNKNKKQIISGQACLVASIGVSIKFDLYKRKKSKI